METEERGAPAAEEENRALRAELEALRAQAAREREEREVLRAAEAALRRSGAVEAAVPLLAGEAARMGASVTRGKLDDEAAVIAGLRGQYAGLFARTEIVAPPPVRPPVPASTGLRAQDLAGMTREEINSNWSAVREALRRKENDPWQ